MRISIIDTAVIIIALLAPVSPGLFSKELVIISFMFLIIRIILSQNISKYFIEKIFILILFCPGIGLAVFNSPLDVLRFAPFILLLLGFPYSGFKLNSTIVAYTSICIIGYLIATQFMIALNNPTLVSFRDYWYPIENNFWDYGSLPSLLYDFGIYRAAGVFYNPNVMGLVLVLYFFVYSTIHSQICYKKDGLFFSSIFYRIIVFFMTFAVILTGSRTAFTAFIGYFFIKVIRSGNLHEIFKNRKLLTLLAIFIATWFFLWERLFEGFTDPRGSANIKFQILVNYLLNADVAMLLFGGTYDVHFDAEYGYWIGAVGFFGMIGWLLTFLLIRFIIPSSLPILIALLLMAIGNTVFYGLLTGAIATILMVIVCTMTLQTNRGTASGWKNPSDYHARRLLRARKA